VTYNALDPVTQIALQRVIEDGHPATPRALHTHLDNDNDLMHAKNDAVTLSAGLAALQTLSVSNVLRNYGDAVDTGRDAEHVPEHDRTSMARRLAMKEQMRAQLDRSIADDRAVYAQLTLDTDLALAD
jgi:hypothetical protein